MPIRTYKNILPSLGKRTYLDETSVLVGDVICDEDVSIWPLVAARGDVNHIRIGARTNIQDGTILHVTRKSTKNPDGYPLIIGEDVTVGHKCMLHGCTVGNRILIGMGAIIMDGANIGENCLVGAGALIPPGKTYPAGSLIKGSPAKAVRDLNEEELKFLKTSVDYYLEYKSNYVPQ